MSGRRRRLVIGGVVAGALVVAGLVIGYVVWPRGSALEDAATHLPKETLRVAWTDWGEIRSELDPGDLTDPDVADEFLLDALDADLSSASATAGDGVALDEQLGFSPQRSDWELLGQSRGGMVLVMDVGDEVDLADVADRFEGFGWERPDNDALDGGVWVGGPDVLANVPGMDNPVFAQVAFLAHDHLLVASDNVDYLKDSMATVRGDEDGLDLEELSGGVDDPVTAVGFVDDYVCEALSMSQADEAAQAEADALIDDVGGVSPLSGYLVAQRADGNLSVVLAFEDEAQAKRNEDARRELAAQEDPGQMEAYPDLFAVDGSEVDDDRVVLDLDPVEGSYAVSNLSQGPVLLASC